MLLTAAMSVLLSSCAPSVGVKTMAGVVEYESGWQPNAIGDNTTRHSYYPASQNEAFQIEVALLSEGHNLDVGLGQVNSENFAAYGLTPSTALDPCTNVHTGAAILAGNYYRAVGTNWLGAPILNQHDVYMEQQYALVHALSAYNTGGFFAGMGYAHNVYQIAQSVRIDFPYAPKIYESVAYEPYMHQAKTPTKKRTHPRIAKLPFHPLWVDIPEKTASEVLMGSAKDDQ